MADLIELTIDGKPVAVKAGATVMDAADQAGIHIPNLCHLKGYKGIGACRLCVVEVAGLKRPMTACTTRVKEGMVVVTDSEAVIDLRRYVIDLILSMHPMNCMTCPKTSVCRLQEYAYDLGLKESSFTAKRFDFPLDGENPFILRDPNYCVLCNRCVRVCKAQGTAVLDVFGRGVGSRIATAGDVPLQDGGCTFCGSCVEVCPVNAIVEAPQGRRGREWEYERFPSICLSCADACDTLVSVRNGRVEKVNAGGKKDTNGGYLCAYGRFGFDAVDSATRVRSPMQRIDGKLTPIEWETALALAAERLQHAGTGSVVTAGNVLNEDLLTMRYFAEAAGLKVLRSTVDAYADAGSLLGAPVEIGGADLILLVGLAPSQWERILPALDAGLRQMVRRGVKLVVINEGETRIAQAAALVIRGEEISALSVLGVALRGDGAVTDPPEAKGEDAATADKIAQVAGLWGTAGRPVVLTVPALYEACVNSFSDTGQVLSIPVEANAKGVVLMGCSGNPVEASKKGTNAPDLLYVVGDVSFPRPEGIDVVIAQCSHLNGLSREADLVFPTTTPYESQGTIVDYSGRLRTLSPVIEPYAEARTHREILRALAECLGLDVKIAVTETVTGLVHEASADQPLPGQIEERTEFSRDLHATALELADHVMTQSPRLSWLRGVKTADLVDR